MSVEATPTGVIHDIGYQRYTGPRLGRGQAVLAIYQHSLRTAFGLGRTMKAKIFPWATVVIIGLVAAIATAVRTQGGDVLGYVDLPDAVSLLVILFCATAAPELVSRDLRGNVLPLYFSRPLTRTDYALAKYAALATGAFLILAGPELLMFAGGGFSVDTWSAFGDETVDFLSGLAYSATFALTFAAISLLVASLAGRRAVAAALIVAVFLVTTPIYGVLASAGSERLEQLAGLVSPMTLLRGVGQWLFSTEESSIGDYGPLYAATTVGLVAFCVALLLVRYRRVAR